MARILIVDDEESIRETLGAFLSNAGHQVEVADDVAKARRLLKEKIFDVVLTDIVMPRITGVELLQTIHQESPGVQVIMMTGQPTVETAAATVRSGAFDYLTKPIARDDILRCVANAARLKATEDERARLAEVNRRHQEELEASYNRLRELEKLRDSLVNMIVNDLRTPLASMLGYLELLKGKISPKISPAELTYLSVVFGNAQKMITMVSSIVDVSRLEAGQMSLNRQAYDLAFLARSVMDSLDSLVGQRRLYLEAPPEPVMANADKEIIQRVISNLLLNALKFTPEFGEVRIVVSRDDSMARVAVTDTGPGIEATYHTKIFEKFSALDECTHGYSTGLGLAFCKLAAETHGGRMGVESEVGKGSTFWLELPA